MTKDKAATAPKLVAYLSALYSAHRGDLGTFPWELESDRWHELIVCLWIGALRIDAALARDGVRRLAEAGWTSPETWMRAVDSERVICDRVLISAGFEKEQADRAVAVAAQAAARIHSACGNDLHLMLRRAGEQLRKELVGLLAGVSAGESEIEKAANLWLQNVANLPLLALKDEHVSAVCRRFRITPDELVAECDRVGLNLAVLDDLLAADHLTRSYLASIAAKPPRRGGRAKRKTGRKQR